MVGQLAACDVRGKGTCVNRRAKRLPVVADGPYVVFVGVGDENAFDVGAACFQPCDIGQDQIHTGCCVHVCEGHAEVDDDQFFFARKAVAIDVGVHPDFTSPTEGQIDQAFSCFFAAHVFSLLCRWMTVKPCIVKSSSKASKSASVCPNRGASPPVEMIRIGTSLSALIRAHISRTSPT